MNLGTGIFSDSLSLDITVICTLLGGFATIIGMLRGMRKSRGEEIQSAISLALNAQPEKVMVSPQPFQVEMAKHFVSEERYQRYCDINRDEHEKLERRLAGLERKMEDDKDAIIKAGEDRSIKIHERINDVLGEVKSVSGQVKQMNIALLHKGDGE